MHPSGQLTALHHAVLTGWTALHHSASLASHTTTDLLLVCGADRLAKDKEVSTYTLYTLRSSIT